MILATGVSLTVFLLLWVTVTGRHFENTSTNSSAHVLILLVLSVFQNCQNLKVEKDCVGFGIYEIDYNLRSSNLAAQLIFVS